MRLDSSPQLLHAQLKITQLASFAFYRFLVYCCIKVLPNLIFMLAILSVANIFLRSSSVLAVWCQSSRHVSEDFESHWRGSSWQRCNKKSAGVCVSKLNDNQLKFKYKCFFSLFSFLFFFIGGRQKHEDQRCYQRDLHHKSCGLLVSNLGMFSVLCNMTWHLNRTVEEK